MKNCIIRPHNAGLWSLINNVATCCELYDNVGVDWRGGHLYDDCPAANLWERLFESPYAKGGHETFFAPSSKDFTLVDSYPDQHLTYLNVAKHYEDPDQSWRGVYNDHWQRWGVRGNIANEVSGYIENTFGDDLYIAVQVRADSHAGEQIGGRNQTLEQYSAAVDDACRHVSQKLGVWPRVLVVAGDLRTVGYFRARHRAAYYPATRRSADRSVDFHLAEKQTFKDAVNCLAEVMIMSQAVALIHPISNMATGALYINPKLKSVYLK